MDSNLQKLRKLMSFRLNKDMMQMIWSEIEKTTKQTTSKKTSMTPRQLEVTPWDLGRWPQKRTWKSRMLRVLEASAWWVLRSIKPLLKTKIVFCQWAIANQLIPKSWTPKVWTQWWCRWCKWCYSSNRISNIIRLFWTPPQACLWFALTSPWTPPLCHQSSAVRLWTSIAA